MLHPYRGILPTVLRGDVAAIRIGARTNIQDGCVVHATEGISKTTVGDDVTVGHRAILHGCTVGDRSLIGMGATVLDNAEIGEECLVGASSLVTVGSKFPPRSMIMGAPAKLTRPLTELEIEMVRAAAAHYVEQARAHRESRAGALR
jgi:carbonic anhydrase/acetyltransferase-like protein (isoleucine patch superfamily)